jgi:hypothetical protein
MAGAIAGALGGLEVVPEAWRRTVASASQLDLETPGREMAAVARELMEADERRRAARQDAFAVLTGDERLAHHLDPA